MKQTALHVAVEVGNPDVISLLLAAGAQLNLRDSVSSTRYLLIVAAIEALSLSK